MKRFNFFWIITLMVGCFFFNGCEKHSFTDYYIVTFDANGGSGTMEPQQVLNDVEQPLKANAFVRENYLFAGWNTLADGSGKAYSDGQKIVGHKDITLYAQWMDNAFEDKTFELEEVSFTLKTIEGGTFKMGAQKNNTTESNYDAEAFEGESPVHDVTLANFWMAETEVTQALWLAVMDNQWPNGYTPSAEYGQGDDFPVYFVSYADAEMFVKRLNDKLHANGQLQPHRFFRLPTEAEWEYAARGGKKSQHFKYAGGNNLDAVAWYEGNANHAAHKVKTKGANELGLYDMSGNVWEWCSDWYDTYPSTSQNNPVGPTYGQGHVVRGGSWYYSAAYQRVSMRLDGGYNPIGSNIGLRLVMSQN